MKGSLIALWIALAGVASTPFISHMERGWLRFGLSMVDGAVMVIAAIIAIALHDEEKWAR